MKMRRFLLFSIFFIALLAHCSGGDDDDDDDASGGESDSDVCGAEEFAQMFNECMGEDRTAEEIEAQYQQDCDDPDGMIECACLAYAENDCDTAQGLLLDCSETYCFSL
jgi:hypothetical protein